MKKFLFLLLIFLSSCQKNFNEYSTTPNILDVKNYIFIQNIFSYGFNNSQHNTVILILIPDKDIEPTKYKFITLRNPNKVQAVLNTLTKTTIFDNEDFSKIEKWLDGNSSRMKKSNINEISGNEEKKLNLDLENKVINSIVLKYNENLPNILLNKKLKAIKKELDGERIESKIESPDSLIIKFEKLKEKWSAEN